MSLIESLNDIAPAIGGVLSIGNFDGVHRGHQQMIARLVELAKERGVPSVVLTFDPHPIQLLAPEKAPPRLTTLRQKEIFLKDIGVDHVIAIPTTQEILNLTATEFFNSVIKENLQAVGLVEGPNFCFGKNRGGDVDLLAELCSDHDMSCDILLPVSVDTTSGEVMISSSVIRDAIAEGRIEFANELLGRPYQFVGYVEHGEARGRSLGFPTANFGGIETLLPPDGVYAGWSNVGGMICPAAINIGGNPTFGEQGRKVEVHFVGYEGDTYGHGLTINVLQRIRGVQKFDSADALVEQIKSDVAETVRIARSALPELLGK